MNSLQALRRGFKWSETIKVQLNVGGNALTGAAREFAARSAPAKVHKIEEYLSL